MTTSAASQRAMSAPHGPPGQYPAASQTTRELKRLRSTFPRPTDPTVYVEMIRRGIFKYYDFIEIDIVASVAKQIIQRGKNDLQNRWNVTPDLIAKAQRIVDLAATVTAYERLHGEPETALEKRDRPAVKRPPRTLDPASIISCGSDEWSVRIPFRDPATGKARIHYKTIRPSKKAAQAYLDWYASLIAAGTVPKTVSQTELRDLVALAPREAAKTRERLRARVAAGGQIEPGPLTLT